MYKQVAAYKQVFRSRFFHRREKQEIIFLFFFRLGFAGITSFR